MRNLNKYPITHQEVQEWVDSILEQRSKEERPVPDMDSVYLKWLLERSWMYEELQ